GLRRAVAAHRGAPAPGGSPGPRWTLVPRTTPDPTEAAYAEAEVLLDRYGVVTRGSVSAEQQAGGGRRDEGPLAGGFAAMYKVLAAAEEAGRLRRGYFVERLGAAQFTTSATIDQLRAVSEDQEDARARQDDDGADPERTVVLAATDPANAYGAALDWPEPPQTGELHGTSKAPHRPGRKAGAVVAIHRGDLVLYMERGGRTMLLFTEDEDLMEVVAVALVERLRAAKTARLAVEQINGAPVLRSAFGAALQRAGFRSSPSGLRFSV
ncbi:Lhr family helicase, partial [Nesterenkonia halophila]